MHPRFSPWDMIFETRRYFMSETSTDAKFDNLCNNIDRGFDPPLIEIARNHAELMRALVIDRRLRKIERELCGWHTEQTPR
jgi:hypothetical protein